MKPGDQIPDNPPNVTRPTCFNMTPLESIQLFLPFFTLIHLFLLTGVDCQAELDRSKQKNGMVAMERYEWEFLPKLVGMFLSTVEGFGEKAKL